jgi:hypothetical protein
MAICGGIKAGMMRYLDPSEGSLMARNKPLVGMPGGSLFPLALAMRNLVTASHLDRLLLDFLRASHLEVVSNPMTSGTLLVNFTHAAWNEIDRHREQKKCELVRGASLADSCGRQ